MDQIVVRILGEQEWRRFRQARLAALAQAPEAFAARWSQESGRAEATWQARMYRAYRIVAEHGPQLVGLVSLGRVRVDPAVGEVFGLWTAPTVRRLRVAFTLVSAAADMAARQGCRRLVCWVPSDSASAIGFATAFGFLPGDRRRPMRPGQRGQGRVEVELVLPLLPDPTRPPAAPAG